MNLLGLGLEPCDEHAGAHLSAPCSGQRAVKGVSSPTRRSCRSVRVEAEFTRVT